MTPSGSGAYTVGGSSVPSNLSPLAPPFKVDKSYLKPNSTNPSLDFSDMPLYGSCFDPIPGQFWKSSSSATSGPNCLATESVVTNTNCSSSANMYAYQDSRSNTLPGNVYYVSTNAVPTYDPFPYEPFSNMSISTDDAAAKPYYPSYAPPPPPKDKYLGVGSGPSYDLLSYSGSALSSGHGTAQVDQPQVMSDDGRCKSKWGLSWGVLNENEHGKWTDYAQGFGSKDLNNSKLSSNKSPLFVEGNNKSQPIVDINVHPFSNGRNNTNIHVVDKNHLKQGASLTQDLGLPAHGFTFKDSCFDIFGGGYNLGSLGIDQLDCKSSSECPSTRTSSFVSVTKEIPHAFTSVSKESPHLQEPVLESIKSYCGSQKANGSSSKDQFSQTGFDMFGSSPTTNTFPIPKAKFPHGGSSSSVENALSAAKLNSMGNGAVNQRNIAVGYSSSYQMELHMPLGLKCQSSIRIRRPVPSSTAVSSCQIGETGDSRLDDKSVSEKWKVSPEPPHQLSLDGLDIKANDTEAVNFSEKYSGGSDGHNPAEDSPCWKGASSNHFTPFGCSESVTSDVFVEKTERSKSLSSQDLQNKSFFMNSSTFKDFYSGKVNEVTSSERPSVSDSSNYNGNCGSANPKLSHFDLNSGDGLQFSDYHHESLIECNVLNKSKAESGTKNSLTARLNIRGEMQSAKNTSETPSSDKSGKGIPAILDSLSGLPSNIDNSLSNLPPVNEASVKSVVTDSNSGVDVNVLLRSMMNLSEILRCYCLNCKVEVGEIQSVAIKQIINNLKASTLIAGGTIPTNVLFSPDSFPQKDFPAVQMVNDAEALAASVKLGRTAKDLLDVSFEDDRNPFGNANKTEAVNKLLYENLYEEDIDKQKLLYKNLWLEAEASLSVMTAKARFLRMKTEMKRTRDRRKDGLNHASSDVSSVSHRAVEQATEDINSSLLIECPKPTTTSQHNHIEVFHSPNQQVACSHFSEPERSGSTKKEICFPSMLVSKPGTSGNEFDDSLTTSHANDVVTSVMARYQILKNRVGCSNSLDYESNQISGENKCPSSFHDSGDGFHDSGPTMKANCLDSSDFGGYQIWKSRDDGSDYLKLEGGHSPGESVPDQAFQDSQLSKSLGVTDEHEASVMARFRILQSRMDHSNSMINISTSSTAVAEDGTEEMGSLQQDFNIKKTSFGPYPDLSQDEQVIAPIVQSNVILEGWYNNDRSSSADWEHISSRDL